MFGPRTRRGNGAACTYWLDCRSTAATTLAAALAIQLRPAPAPQTADVCASPRRPVDRPPADLEHHDLPRRRQRPQQVVKGFGGSGGLSQDRPSILPLFLYTSRKTRDIVWFPGVFGASAASVCTVYKRVKGGVSGIKTPAVYSAKNWPSGPAVRPRPGAGSLAGRPMGRTLFTKARPIATRCCCPPDICEGS